MAQFPFAQTRIDNSDGNHATERRLVTSLLGACWKAFDEHYHSERPKPEHLWGADPRPSG
jgi:hypothetical protein